MYTPEQYEQQASQTDLPELVSEGLEYFWRAGDAGDKEYVRAIREHIAALTRQQAASAEPVAWIRAHRSHTDSGMEYDEEVVAGSDMPTGIGWLPLYTATPPSVPDAKGNPDEVPSWVTKCTDAAGVSLWIAGWNACRDAMLAAAPKVTP